MIQMFFLKCVIHLKLNLIKYKNIIIRTILKLVLLTIKKTLKFSQLLMLPMKTLKLKLKLHMVAKIMNLIYQEVVYFVKLHIYWLENVMNFMVPSQKNTLSSISVLQPKSLCFHYIILKVPCLLQCFGLPLIKTIMLRDQCHHLFYQDCVNKTVLLIFQLTFSLDSQMLLLPQVQTIVAQFLGMT